MRQGKILSNFSENFDGENLGHSASPYDSNITRLHF